jgi:hypothetical protein
MTQTDVWNFVSGFRKHENRKTFWRLIFFSVISMLSSQWYCQRTQSRALVAQESSRSS